MFANDGGYEDTLIYEASPSEGSAEPEVDYGPNDIPVAFSLFFKKTHFLGVRCGLNMHESGSHLEG